MRSSLSILLRRAGLSHQEAHDTCSCQWHRQHSVLLVMLRTGFLRHVLPPAERHRTQTQKGSPEKGVQLRLSKDALPLGRSLMVSSQAPPNPLPPQCDSVTESRGREGVGLPSDVNLWYGVGSGYSYRYLFEGLLGAFHKGPKTRESLP